MAHSPNTYDRAAIVVSPNPLALPAYGDRVFSPTSGVFKSSSQQETTISTPTIEVSEFKLAEPPTPIVVPEVTKPAKAKQTRASVRFQQNLAAKKPAPLPRDDLGNALLKFPRSPYPTAPTASPAGKENNVNMMTETTRARGTGVTKETKRPAPLTAIGAAAESKVPFSAAVEAETAEDRLSQDFWRSVTLETDTPVSAKVPQFVFGTKDGTLWSPGLARKKPLEPVGLSSMLSPLSRTSFGQKPKAQALMSPTPNDPFSAFPSFTAVLSTGAAEMITYPPRAVVEL